MQATDRSAQRGYPRLRRAGMQKIAAEQLGLSPNLMGAANSAGDILRYVFFHSIALACLMSIFVTLQAYVYPFTLMVIH
ncbi:hypothetical protein [Thauera sinica]|uniref:Uncharacterized protein n=1 Tax=Thauera sinica TaxID=2665146 RepID=A0ABW1AW22_9RHOO|nr:hypothetical protein [Thauera sp. K11]